MQVGIVGAGIAGLTLALEFHDAGIGCRIYEAVPEIRPVGLGINVLPHATKILAGLGVLPELERVAVPTQESAFFNRFGQLIYREPAGRAAGYEFPQLSIHRGDLQDVLLAAVRERMGEDAVQTGWACTGVESLDGSVRLLFEGDEVGEQVALAVACDGLHSRIRKQLHPDEGAPRYSGVNMWRGTAVLPPFLTGASMVRAGWLSTGKLVVYPIRDNVDGRGSQLINWVVEIETAKHLDRDWNRPGDLADFLPAVEDWHFDWLDVPNMIRSSEKVFEFPMIDQDPLPFWGTGRVTLMGDAAHPMYPRGSNGAGQAILDARALRDALTSHPDPEEALRAYEHVRRPATAAVVETNRRNPPDAILREVWSRSGDQPFEYVEDVISEAELRAISESYKSVAGFSLQAADYGR